MRSEVNYFGVFSFMVDYFYAAEGINPNTDGVYIASILSYFMRKYKGYRFSPFKLNIVITLDEEKLRLDDSSHLAIALITENEDKALTLIIHGLFLSLAIDSSLKKNILIMCLGIIQGMSSKEIDSLLKIHFTEDERNFQQFLKEIEEYTLLVDKCYLEDISAVQKKSRLINRERQVTGDQIVKILDHKPNLFWQMASHKPEAVLEFQHRWQQLEDSNWREVVNQIFFNFKQTAESNLELALEAEGRDILVIILGDWLRRPVITSSEDIDLIVLFPGQGQASVVLPLLGNLPPLAVNFVGYDKDNRPQIMQRLKEILIVSGFIFYADQTIIDSCTFSYREEGCFLYVKLAKELINKAEREEISADFSNLKRKWQRCGEALLCLYYFLSDVQKQELFTLISSQLKNYPIAYGEDLSELFVHYYLGNLGLPWADYPQIISDLKVFVKARIESLEKLPVGSITFASLGGVPNLPFLRGMLANLTVDDTREIERGISKNRYEEVFSQGSGKVLENLCLSVNFYQLDRQLPRAPPLYWWGMQNEQTIQIYFSPRMYRFLANQYSNFFPQLPIETFLTGLALYEKEKSVVAVGEYFAENNQPNALIIFAIIERLALIKAYPAPLSKRGAQEVLEIENYIQSRNLDYEILKTYFDVLQHPPFYPKVSKEESWFQGYLECMDNRLIETIYQMIKKIFREYVGFHIETT
ncbi:MAG: hypothetical protein AB1472_07305, partial [Candidatus Omnitrophota bacterium]